MGKVCALRRIGFCLSDDTKMYTVPRRKVDAFKKALLWPIATPFPEHRVLCLVSILSLVSEVNPNYPEGYNCYVFAFFDPPNDVVLFRGKTYRRGSQTNLNICVRNT
jgi:hypothetical protein